jgi:hypothetical protein
VQNDARRADSSGVRCIPFESWSGRERRVELIARWME